MNRQLSLPSIDMRPICPMCGRTSDVLGQYMPDRRLVWLCRDCSTVFPLDTNVYMVNTKGRLVTNQDITSEAVAHHNWITKVIEDAAEGCFYVNERANDRTFVAPCEIRQYAINCKRCMRKYRHDTRYLRMGKKTPGHVDQFSLPVCERCGNIHNNRYTYLGNQPAQYCEICDAKNSVEAFWRHKGIFGDADVEDILDRIQKSHPEAFEVGVLPDYWFELMAKEQT